MHRVKQSELSEAQITEVRSKWSTELKGQEYIRQSVQRTGENDAACVVQE